MKLYKLKTQTATGRQLEVGDVLKHYVRFDFVRKQLYIQVCESKVGNLPQCRPGVPEVDSLIKSVAEERG